MHTIGAKAFGPRRIMLDQARKAARLHQVDEARSLDFVGRRFLSAKQHASGVGTCQRLGDLSVERCQRRHRDLKIQPATMLDFGHHQRVSAASLVDRTLTAPVSNHTARGAVNVRGLEPKEKSTVVEDRSRCHHIDIKPRVQQLVDIRLAKLRRLSGEGATR
jgi:hypothetical protein